GRLRNPLRARDERSRQWHRLAALHPRPATNFPALKRRGGLLLGAGRRRTTSHTPVHPPPANRRQHLVSPSSGSASANSASASRAQPARRPPPYRSVTLRVTRRVGAHAQPIDSSLARPQGALTCRFGRDCAAKTSSRATPRPQVYTKFEPRRGPQRLGRTQKRTPNRGGTCSVAKARLAQSQWASCSVASPIDRKSVG